MIATKPGPSSAAKAFTVSALAVFYAGLIFIGVAANSRWAWFGVGAGMLGMTVGLMAVGGNVLREHETESNNLLEVLWLGALEMRAFAGGFAVFAALMAVHETVGDRMGAWSGVLLAAIIASALFGGMLVANRHVNRKEGVEREIYLRGTSTAFIATFIASGTYGIFEAVADAPPLSLWNVYVFAGVAWIVGAARARRQVQ